MHQEPEPSRHDAEPGQPRKGWQKRATEQVDVRFLRLTVRPPADTEAAPSAFTGEPRGISRTHSHPFQEGIPVGTTVFSPPLLPPSQAPIAFVCLSTSLATTVQRAGQQGF